jgi:hypothetical protein
MMTGGTFKSENPGLMANGEELKVTNA